MWLMLFSESDAQLINDKKLHPLPNFYTAAAEMMEMTTMIYSQDDEDF